jgi:DNA polymerase-1
MPAPRLFLIDGYSNIYRAFYAIRELSSSKGEPTNAVYGFVNMLRKLLREEQPEYLGVALDLGAPTVRSEKFADYKANRSPTPEDLLVQIPRVRQALAGYRIPALELAGHEADDVLGTIATRAAAAGFEVVIVSADKDLMQLVRPGVRVYHSFRNKLYDEALVEADFGVTPAQIVDLLALLGDAIDNVPGVPGIGEKGAPQLVRQYGSLEALLSNAAELPNKRYREGLLGNREQALLSKELVTIHTDLPIAFDPAALRRQEPDAAVLEALFGELEFFSLRDEIAATRVRTSSVDALAEVETVEELRATVGPWLAGGPVVVVGIGALGGGEGAVATTEGRGAEVEEDGEIEAEAAAADSAGAAVAGATPNAGVPGAGGRGRPPLALAIGRPGGAGRLLDLRRGGLAAEIAALLTSALANPQVEIWGHDLKELLRALGPLPRPRARLLDAMLLSYLIRPSQHGHGLAEIALERLRLRAMSREEAGFAKGSEPMVGAATLAQFAAERLDLVARLVPEMRGEIATGALAEVYARIEEPLLWVLVNMEEAGIELDLPFLATMHEELRREIGDLEASIYAIAGERFNIDSPGQLGAILFEKLGYPVLKRTQKTRSYSTAAEVLEELANRGYPLPERLLRYRELSKLDSTYVVALPAQVDAGGRLHTRYEQAVAATGRLSSVNPNLQNIPVRSEVGRRIRQAFRAPAGRLLLVADYNQIELRVLAHIAAEPALVEAFRAGQDIHRSTAARVLGVAPELVNAEQRRAAKTINFGILYGMSPFGLSKALAISTKEAEGFIAAYLAQYPRVRAYMEETQAMAEQTGKVETLFGRVRWLPEIASKNRNVRENARRMAINARIQGTAADLLKLAMIAVADRLAAAWPGARLLLTVHDELVLEVPADVAVAVGAEVRAAMEGVADLAVPLRVDVGSGPTWYAAKA